MKKLFIIFTISYFASLTSVQAENSDPYQAIITECGTVHQIPKDSTEDQALKALNDFEKDDC